MSTKTAMILMALVAGVPILVMILFVTRQLWKEFNWKSKVAEGLMWLGGIILAICLLSGLSSQSPQEFLDEELIHVRGTVEEVYHDWGAEWEPGVHFHEGSSHYRVQINGQWYMLEDNWNDFRHFCDFEPYKWAREAEGQVMELTISRHIDILTLDDYSGTVYGIRDEAGTVILDEEVYRAYVYPIVEENAKELPFWTVGGILTIVAGIFVKFKLKW